MMEERFSDVPCDLCAAPARLNTVPLRLIPAGCPPWQTLCDTCFGQEPWDSLKMKPIRGIRGRR
jgi:hypothetical protein